MRTRILTLTALILALGSSVNAAQPLPAHLRNVPASTVLDRILAGRGELGLNPVQVERLTVLSNQMRHERGRLVVRGLDGVPGKSVPRLERIRTSATEAFHQALRVLDPDQRAKASQLLDTLSR